MPTIIDLTIAIITFNRPQQLKACLKTIRHQKKYSPKKILIIRSDPRLTTLPKSRNSALEKCRTKYIAFVDDDCLLDQNWLIEGYNSIQNTTPTFVVGQTLPIQPLNFFSQLQFNEYYSWFSSKSSPSISFSNNEILDTKNIIIDITKIKSIRFDTRFKIFEDIDFGLQLKKAGLKGLYNSKMIIHHAENHELPHLIKKNYRRGKFKKILSGKWGNFDNFTPSLRILSPLKLAFTLGYIRQKIPLITIVNSLDLGANGQRAKHFYKFITQFYSNVQIIDSTKVFYREAFCWDNLLIYNIKFIKYHLFQILKYIFHIDFTRQHYKSYLQLRGQIISRYLHQSHTDLAIIQYPEDMLSIKPHQKLKFLFDSPTIYHQEIKQSTRFSPEIENLEKKAYQIASWVSFHWQTYFDLLHQINIFPKRELVLNWGCQPTNKTCHFTINPKIIYLGTINSSWINPKLLIKLSKLCQIDIYSYEKPDPEIYPKNSINYCGYLKDITRLSEYQFGLITLTKDNLRRHGFSAKYLDYLNYGLPTLCPKWRHDPVLSQATISYDLKNFSSQINKYSNKKYWLAKHKNALQLANQLQWSKNLIPLKSIIDSLFE